jgi:hypothetical protein
MAGKPGRSGRPKLSLAHHLLSGTYRPDRHGPKPTTRGANALATEAAPGWMPDPADLQGIGEAGRVFVVRWLDAYEVSLAEGAQLLELAHVVDRLTAVRAALASAVEEDRPRLMRLEMAWLRSYAALMAPLRVSK